MRLTAHRASEEFGRIAVLPEERIDLARAAMLIAAEFQSELDPDLALKDLAAIAEPLKRRLRPDQSDFQQVTLLTRHLFQDLGFRGNEEDYYDPKNSLLNHVLERRLGIPISLSLVMIEVGARVGIPIEGIGFPGHFLVRHARQRQLVFDPFHGGELLTLTECAELFARVAGSEAGFDPKYLAPAGPREILVRLITNLKSLFVRHNQLQDALRMVDKLLLLHPGDHQNLRDRGLLKVQTGEVGAGIADLESYLESEPEPADQQTVEALIERARSDQSTVH